MAPSIKPGLGGSIEFFSRGSTGSERETEDGKSSMNRFISQSRIITPSTANNKINHSLVKTSVMPVYANARACANANFAVVI